MPQEDSTKLLYLQLCYFSVFYFFEIVNFPFTMSQSTCPSKEKSYMYTKMSIFFSPFYTWESIQIKHIWYTSPLLILKWHTMRNIFHYSTVSTSTIEKPATLTPFALVWSSAGKNVIILIFEEVFDTWIKWVLYKMPVRSHHKYFQKPCNPCIPGGIQFKITLKSTK